MALKFAFPTSQLHWWLLMAAGFIALVVWLLAALERRRRARLDLFVAATLASRLLPGYDAAVRKPLFWLTVIGFAALTIALAQPRWGQAWQETQRESRDILVLLDTSESMNAANPLPTRMHRAKQKILSLLEKRPGDRFGLIAFAGAAELQCPLTLDHGYFRAVLNAVDTDTISRKGTDIASALATAVKTFQKDEESTGYANKDTRAVFLISDGEQVSGDAVKAAEAASKYAHVIVMGVGDPNGTELKMPDIMGRYRTVMDGGKPHISKLDEETLRKVAAAGSGAYTRAIIESWDVDQIHERIDTLARRSMESDIRYRLVNRYQWPLAVALFCFAGEGAWLAAMPWVRRWRLHRQARVAGDPDHA
ncbi:MAG TPA: VWA domain-containing protein [Candidatus Hydrogenedentes bacterium]|nr:VWA domain-containing protein [Candidatus Hydrogenedentota bacterium]HOS02377.1 VWA domain-containing protein [Candidatus Hydrogenedentota bacterium]